MRLSAVLAALVVLTSPAIAAPDSIADQAQRAYGLYAGALSQAKFMGAHYGEALFSRIAGKWVRLDGPDNKTGIETYGADSEKACKTAAALTLASTSPLTLALSTHLPDADFNQTYTLVAGSTFAEHTDPDSYLKAAGLGPEKTGDAVEQQRALVLSLANGLVQIYRPSEDILVLTRDRGYPTVLARCPGA